MADIRNFRHACYAAARRTGGKVVEFRIVDGVTPNFHQGLIAYHDRTIAVVCTRDSTLLAVAEPRTLESVSGVGESGALTFVDVPALAAVLGELPGFQVLTPSELNGPLDPASWPEALPEDIEYWRPGTLGEALFNYWD
ncbi:hypothetical protein [Thermomonospora umbrina]|uniref:Uncharacterized protein n=1 Tax=Thermomonospora umbrina TaxID=111806 RepID=A0A3D9T1F2_9ACTN|nr:hypothetical protein [Thermomonospora umbrina]REF00661.1 hypothetical protein DFJ69_6217 [Thermomonospora umbrina]